MCALTLANDVGGAVAAALDLLGQIERALPRLRDRPFGIRADRLAAVFAIGAGIAIVEAGCASRRDAHPEQLLLAGNLAVSAGSPRPCGSSQAVLV
jgi:hypothetical protein